MKRLHKFLDHNSSKNDIDNPSCPLNKTSHKTTADKIIFKAFQTPKELLLIKKFVKNPQNKICTDGQ